MGEKIEGLVNEMRRRIYLRLKRILATFMQV